MHNLPFIGLWIYSTRIRANVIVSINPGSNYNLINVNLAKRLQVPTKHIQSAHVEGEKVHFFKDLKIMMDKYVLR